MGTRIPKEDARKRRRPGSSSQHGSGSDAEKPPVHKKSNAGRTIDDILLMQCDEGSYDYVKSDMKALFVCNVCCVHRDGVDPRKNLSKPMEGRVLAGVSRIVSKAKEHIR